MTRRIILLVALALLGAGVIAATWLLATETGLQWAYAQWRARAPDAPAIETLHGRLAGPLELRGVDYRSSALDARIDRARLDWSPLALLVGRLEIDELAVDGAHIRLKDNAAPAEARPRDFALPLTVAAADVRLQDIAIERPGETPYRIHSLEMAGAVGAQVAHLDYVRVAAETFELQARGAVALQDDTEQRLNIDWRVTLPDVPAVAGSGDIAGKLTDFTLTQKLTEPFAASVEARIQNAPDEPTWQATVEVPAFDGRDLGLDLPVTHMDLRLEASGDRAQFQTAGSLNAQLPNLPPLAGRFRARGSIAGEIVLEQLTVRAAGTDAQLALQGRWQPEERAWQAQARWQNIQWPLTGDAAVASPSGALEAAGDLVQYRVQLSAATRGENLPPAEWAATGAGDRTHIALDKVTLETLGAILTGAVRAQWSPQLQWRASLKGDGLDPGARWPEWPGSLALRATLAGGTEEIRAHIEELRGTLRGHALAATARAARRGDAYPTLALEVRSGDARAAVSGSLGDRWDLSWRVDAPALDALLPGTAGRLNASGRLNGPRAAPRIEAKLSGTGLAYETTRIEHLTLDAAIDLSDRTRSLAMLRARGGAVFARPFEQLVLDAGGHLMDHSAAVELRAAEVALQAQLAGSYADAAWNGVLRDSTLRILNEDWRLVGRPEISVGAARAALAETCWRHAGARTCVALRHAGGAETTLTFVAQRLPLALFDPLLAETVELEGGSIDGNAQVRLAGGRLRQADARLALGPGVAVLTAPAVTRLKYQSAELRLAVDDRGLRAEATLALPNGDGGAATLALPGFQPDADIMQQPAEGRLTAALRELAPLAPFFPQIAELRGTLKIDLALAGTLDDPRLQGEAALTDAAARIPAAGINVERLRLSATAAGGDELRLNGEAYSGGGQLGLSGRVVFAEDRAWRAEVRIAGSQFQAADLREARVYVSPDLRARIGPGEVDVTGDVRIPRATFALRQPERDAVAVSPDVVIVNAPDTPPPRELWKVTAQVQVTLGDAVTIAGFGLSARITGSVLLVDTPGQATTARGELRVAQGVYEAYGQKLEVERGRLLFVGGPVSNPGIDARAVRRVDQVTAGVEVKGTLQSPQLTLFSDPAMGQSDALSYLLFGRPVARASTSEGQTLAAAARALRLAGGERLAKRIGTRFGIEEIDIETGTTPETAALVLGKQLSPRLYINYSIGLFEPVNVLRLRYRLSRYWSLEAESGPAAGGDLIYTIER